MDSGTAAPLTLYMLEVQLFVGDTFHDGFVKINFAHY
jgi:hypothetical protein